MMAKPEVFKPADFNKLANPQPEKSGVEKGNIQLTQWTELIKNASQLFTQINTFRQTMQPAQPEVNVATKIEAGVQKQMAEMPKPMQEPIVQPKPEQPQVQKPAQVVRLDINGQAAIADLLDKLGKAQEMGVTDTTTVKELKEMLFNLKEAGMLEPMFMKWVSNFVKVVT